MAEGRGGEGATTETFLGHLMDLLAVTVFGVVYAIATLVLLALGLAVIFGMMGVINLAQAEFLMLGAYTVLFATSHGASVWAGIALAPLVVALIGVVIERTIIQFLYGRMLDTMLATWGLSLALVGTVTLVFGPTTEGIATPLGYLTVGRYSIAHYNVFVVLAALGALGLTYGLFNYTVFGLVARATMQNATMVAGLGMNPARVYMATFAYGSALAGLGGAIMAPLTGVVPTLGLAFIAKIFITVIVGGPVILLGTTASGAVLGLVESIVSYASTPIYGQVAMLAFAIVLLRLLPQGISGFWRRGV
jgi:branched-chain amino acid transport system permease protein